MHQQSIVNEAQLSEFFSSSKESAGKSVLSEVKNIFFSHSVTFDVFRHGQTEFNAKRLVTGATDVPLTPTGVQQAKQLSAALQKKYDVAFCSTLERSRKTLLLAIQTRQIQVRQTLKDARLNERKLGELEGKPAVPIREFSEGDFHFAPPGGESYLTVTEKLWSFLLDLADFIEKNSYTTVLLSTHMGPLRLLKGIWDSEVNTKQILSFNFDNTQVLHRTLEEIPFPPFLQQLL